jgi:hypothetical protein
MGLEPVECVFPRCARWTEGVRVLYSWDFRSLDM